MIKSIERDKRNSDRAFPKGDSTSESGERLSQLARTQSDVNRYRFLLSAREKRVIEQVRKEPTDSNRNKSSGLTTKSGDYFKS